MDEPPENQVDEECTSLAIKSKHEVQAAREESDIDIDTTDITSKSPPTQPVLGGQDTDLPGKQPPSSQNLQQKTPVEDGVSETVVSPAAIQHFESDSDTERKEEKPVIIEMPVDVRSVAGETITLKLVVQGASPHVIVVYMLSLEQQH